MTQMTNGDSVWKRTALEWQERAQKAEAEVARLQEREKEWNFPQLAAWRWELKKRIKVLEDENAQLCVAVAALAKEGKTNDR